MKDAICICLNGNIAKNVKRMIMIHDYLQLSEHDKTKGGRISGVTSIIKYLLDLA